MENIELQSFYYTDVTIINVVWRVQKQCSACVVNVAVGEKKKTIVDLRKDETKFVTLIHNEFGTNCYYIDEVKQREDEKYVPVVEKVDDIEMTARNIVKFLDCFQF